MQIRCFLKILHKFNNKGMEQAGIGLAKINQIIVKIHQKELFSLKPDHRHDRMGRKER